MKTPKIKIIKGDNGKVYLALFAGNGSELFRSPPQAKKGNAERCLERIRAALPLAQTDWKSETSHDVSDT